ncbi:TIR domain-containing protein, partial [Chloroflexota bacterium]
MGQLFISYRRKSWGFTHRLAAELDELLADKIFIDLNIDDANFQNALLGNLRESDAVLLIVSEHTFASDRIHRADDWVRREIREALAHNIPIVLALVDGRVPPDDLPADIQAIQNAQGIEFYPRYFEEGVQKLAQFLDRATPLQLRPVQVTHKEAPARLPQSDRAKLAALVSRDVKHKLTNDLFNHILIELDMDRADDALNLAQPFHRKLSIQNKTETLPTSAQIGSVFVDQVAEQLLILGAPGAGKTTALYTLAETLVQRAQDSEAWPVPVILNLASWTGEHKTLPAWMLTALRDHYDIPS